MNDSLDLGLDLDLDMSINFVKSNYRYYKSLFYFYNSKNAFDTVIFS